VSELYRVALSFAGAQREYVERVARAIQARGISVFYDGFEQATLWGKDGIEFLEGVYARNSNYVVMFVSKDYVAKSWPRHERRSALTKAIEQAEEYILPVRFDDSPVPGLPSSIQYLQAERYTPEQLAAMIGTKLGVPRFAGKASDVAAPQMSSMTGEVAFDYTSYNGRYVIGTGPSEFETRWSGASNVSIHAYNEGNNVNGVALLEHGEIEELAHAGDLDFTSRVRTAQEGQVLVWRNTNGFYAATRIVDVLAKNRGDNRNEVRFRYVILPDGTADFTLMQDSL
jgi:hypothetical protein